MTPRPSAGASLGKGRATAVDWVLLLLVLLITATGLLNLYSASMVDDTDRHLAQLSVVLVGLGVGGAIASQDYRLFERGAYFIWGAVVVLLVATLLVGTTINGSRRWLDLGPFMLQSSELAKLAVILVTARYFHDHERPEGHGLRDLMVPALLAGLPFVLILEQPDLGTGLVVLLIFGTICVFEGIRRGTLLGLGAASVVTAPVLWFLVMRDYQKDRVIAFLNPTDHLQGDAWQVSQSKIAIGSGRWLGKGYLQGTQVQNGFVPYHESDFIFAHHGEQFGFLGSVVLLVLYFALILWCLRIARYGRDRFAVLTAVGVAAFLFWHVVVNVGMVTGALPVVGLWLPLASFGRSAVMTTMILLGLLMGISMRRHVF